MNSRPTITTHASLLARLKNGDDVDSWNEFFRTYRDLLRDFARKAGLTDEESEDVIQETAIGVSRNLPGFRYDPARCSFKTWMLNLAHWRILDALRRRRIPGAVGWEPTGYRAANANPDSQGIPNQPWVEKIPDPHVPDFGSEWDAAWERNLQRVAMTRVRESLDPEQFQIFDLYVLKDRPAREVATRIGIGVAKVYLVKQRVTARLRREMRMLEREAEKCLLEAGD